ncbi:heat shock protein HslJ [Actinoalloteichus hoggarensis]|uniref:META domain protein n=1 Tax=Actinoalloteichus hoggarensis TaxID=1470176 RepID=A0A221W3L6_9PSEU|nr:META domain-containing protein [Actinoalloteichus hoggarensis]ASO20231.1 META domain protein [Actinoalloteichus hoggarensis]MBB5919055.1 heat shock protein HslJ [Actinoalloteichus hoggarensis]
MRDRGVVAAVCGALLVLGGCGHGEPTAAGVTSAEIDGWQLVGGETADGPLTPDERYPVTLDFEDGGIARGTAACDDYGMSVRWNGARVSFDHPSQTRTGCVDAGMTAIEGRFLAALAAVDEAVERSAETPVLSGRDVEPRFAAPPRVRVDQLVDRTWRPASPIDEHGTETAAVGDPLELRLDEQTLRADLGCRELDAAWLARTGAVVFTRSDTGGADLACDDVPTEQEQRVGAVVGDGCRAAVDDDRLNLTSTLGGERLSCRGAG